jgi:2-methylisocitrate lyase-like PEP mutase family enzyme
MPNFRSLHDNFLLLPNAWDAGSARLIESLGAAAIATTSAGVAWSCGYPDGDVLPLEQLLNAVREIAHAIWVPLTVDIEGGYSNKPAAVAHVVSGIIEAGAVGINIEDGANSPEILCAKIKTARESAGRANCDLFINVRTDIYLRGLFEGEIAVEEVLRRAELYRAAGADGLFVPGLADVQAIQTIAKSIDPMPLNIMLVQGLPSVEVLRKNGVRRFSTGAAIAMAALGLSSQLAKNFLAGSREELFKFSVDYNAMNQLFQSR